ncbi:MAG: tetratricopeptide repeat protein [Planctomycetota bacterium]|jgi:tetratricopeptide (TPR) repeat protein
MRIRWLLFLLMAPALVAAQETKNAELARKLKERKIARFFKTLEGHEALDAALKAKILKLKEGATLGGEYGCIHQALLLLHPDYKRADALLLNERLEAAAGQFDKLRGATDTYLKAYATYRYGVAQMNRERYEEAAAAFSEVLNDHGRYVGCDIDSAFYLVICLGQALEKEKAIVAANAFLEDYPDAPERYRKAMEQIRNELVQEWESPLYELAGRMNHVARKIEGGETGKPTQEKQQEIVSIIDELIRRAKEQEGNSDQDGGGGPPRGNDQPSSPANRSQAPPGSSRTGDLRPKPKRKPGDQWGEMRDKERDDVLQALKEKFPDRYRELLEQYHKALAEGKRVTEPAEER